MPVSAFDADGTFPTATSKYEKRGIAEMVPVWNNETCLQCGKCALICPHGAIRTKVLTEEQLKNAPNTFKVAKYKTKELGDDLYYCVQVSPKDCTGCGLCVAGCPVKTSVGEDKVEKALVMKSIQEEMGSQNVKVVKLELPRATLKNFFIGLILSIFINTSSLNLLLSIPKYLIASLYPLVILAISLSLLSPP